MPRARPLPADRLIELLGPIEILLPPLLNLRHAQAADYRPPTTPRRAGGSLVRAIGGCTAHKTALITLCLPPQVSRQTLENGEMQKWSEISTGSGPTADTRKPC